MEYLKHLIKCITDEEGGLVGGTPKGMGHHIL